MKDLRLREEGRELIYKGTLKRRGGQGDSGDLQVFLFDHALLMVKQKDKNKHEMHKVYRRVMSLLLLQRSEANRLDHQAHSAGPTVDCLPRRARQYAQAARKDSGQDVDEAQFVQ